MTGAAENGPPGAGAPVPHFRFASALDRGLDLAALRARPAVLVFYPVGWSPVSSDGTVLYQQLRPRFEVVDTRVVGISVDGVWCHRAFAEHRSALPSPAPDLEPEGAVSRAFDADPTDAGVDERACFVLDPSGVVHWSHLAPIGMHPGPGRMRRAGGAPGSGPVGTTPRTTTWESVHTVPVAPGRHHVLGPPGTPLTMVEYGDYDAPGLIRALQTAAPWC